MFGLFGKKKSTDQDPPEVALQKALEAATRRKWQVVSFSPESITVELAEQLSSMKLPAYNKYIEELKNLSDCFFIENSEYLKCRVKTKKVDRFMSVINENQLKFQKLVNDGIGDE